MKQFKFSSHVFVKTFPRFLMPVCEEKRRGRDSRENSDLSGVDGRVEEGEEEEEEEEEEEVIVVVVDGEERGGVGVEVERVEEGSGDVEEEVEVDEVDEAEEEEEEEEEEEGESGVAESEPNSTPPLPFSASSFNLFSSSALCSASSLFLFSSSSAFSNAPTLPTFPPPRLFRIRWMSHCNSCSVSDNCSSNSPIPSSSLLPPL